MSVKALAGIAVVLHLVIAFCFAAITPYRTPGLEEGVFKKCIGGPDELAHGKFIQHLVEGRGLPSPVPTNNMYTYEAHQPPLYYIVAAGWAKLGGCTDFNSQRTGIWLRLLSVLLGGATVAGACSCAWLASRSKAMTFGTGLIVALLPMSIGISSWINNDTLLNALGVWVLAICLKAHRDGWNYKWAALAGFLIGLGLLTKTLAAGLLFTLACSIFISRPKNSLKVFAVAAGIAVALGSIVWIRNAMLYHDPLMLGSFEKMSQMDAMPKITGAKMLIRLIVVFFQQTTASFYGVLGLMNTRYPFELYAVLVLFTGWAVIGCLRHRREKQDLPERAADWIFFCHLAAALALYIRFNLSHTEPQARYFFIALVSIAYFHMRGFLYWARTRRKIALACLAAILLLLDGYMGVILKTYNDQMIANLKEAGGPAAFDDKPLMP